MGAGRRMLGLVEREATLTKAKKKKTMCDSIKWLCWLISRCYIRQRRPDPQTEFKGDTRVHVAVHVASLSLSEILR